MENEINSTGHILWRKKDTVDHAGQTYNAQLTNSLHTGHSHPS